MSFFNFAYIIIPVYKDFNLTHKCIESCIHSVIDHNSRIILLNDCSPELEMQTMLESWHSKHPNRITLIKNSENLGFTATVNIGLNHAKGSHVVLLNSDVITPRYWLTTLFNEANTVSPDHMGTLTPLSNNSTITSIPLKNEGSDYLLDGDVNQINEAMVDNFPLVPAPSGIGFCMLINKKCLHIIPKLDVENFEKGYGEENDFCQKCLKHGFINYITPNLYCHHVGSVSFGSSSLLRMEKACNTMQKLHPCYHSDVANWIQKNYLGLARVIRSVQSYKSLGRPIVLYISHGLGGGIQKHIHDLTASCGQSLYPIILTGKRDNNSCYKVNFGVFSENCSLKAEFEYDEDLIKALSGLEIDMIHIHHLYGISKELVKWITNKSINQYSITLHDYYIMGGNPFLLNSQGKYCGVEAKKVDSPLIPQDNEPFASENWKTKSKELLDNSLIAIFPSFDTLNRYKKGLGELSKAQVVSHQEILCKKNTLNEDNTMCNFSLKAISIGALSKEKGADYLEELCSLLKSKGLLIDFKIIGYSYQNLKNIAQSGPYQDSDLTKLINLENPDYIFFTSICPETYSYTLTNAIISNRFIIAPSLGAYKERLINYPNHYIYDSNDSIQVVSENIHKLICKRSKNNQSAFSSLNNFYTSAYLIIAKQSFKPTNNISMLIKDREIIATKQKSKFLMLFLMASYRLIPARISKKIPLPFLRNLKNIIYPHPMN